MREDATAEWVVSREDISELTDYFREFERACPPLPDACLKAEAAFDNKVSELFIKAHLQFKELTLQKFKSYVRLVCRKRLCKEMPNFPCVMPTPTRTGTVKM